MLTLVSEMSITDNVSHDPNEIIYNFLDYHLTGSDRLLLIRGLNFAFLLPFELLFREIKSTSESSVDLANIKVRLQDAAFTFRSVF